MSEDFIGLTAILVITYWATVWWFLNYITTFMRNQTVLNDKIINYLSLSFNDESE